MRGITFTLANNGEEVVVDEGKTLGKGNYGVVYKGIHKPTGGGVAVKEILFPEDDPEECEYLKEVRRAPRGWMVHVPARGRTRPDACTKQLLSPWRRRAQDWANEVKMCQRVDHPCCIKTLGWAKSPKYLIVQELVGFGWAAAPACGRAVGGHARERPGGEGRGAARA